jgi:acyl dehydratase
MANQPPSTPGDELNAALQPGQVESIRRAFSQSDFDRFAALSGDDNPIHVDPEFAARTKFGRTVAHGMFLYSVVCGVLSTRLPGPGTLQREQELMFPTPTYVGETVTIRVEVTRVHATQGAADLDTFVVRPGGQMGLQGRTLIQLPGATVPRELSPPQPSPRPERTEGSFKGLHIGHRVEIRRAFSQADLDEYAGLTGDANPLFSDAAYARRQGLAGPTIPGGLLGGLFSTLLGTELPGRGTNYLKQRLLFPRLAVIDQELTASVEIVRIRPEKQLVNLRTVCTNPEGLRVCQGEALVLVSDVEPKT